jgi:hypothetical protein
MISTTQLIFQILAITFSTTSAIFLVYIEWTPEERRSGHVVSESNNLQKAINKLGKGEPFKSNRWYITVSLIFLAVGIVFQVLALVSY